MVFSFFLFYTYFTGPSTDLSQYDIPVPDGYVVDNPLDAKAVVTKIGESLMAEAIITDTKSSNLDQGEPSMLKSQILAGGRGKGKFDTDGKGGVRMVST